jgi:hypothetical protein
VQIWHPDRFPKDPALQREAQFATKRINEAYLALRPARRARSGPFHRTRRSPWSSSVEQARVRSTWAVDAPADWDGRRILSIGLVLLIVIGWLALSALLVWALMEWD